MLELSPVQMKTVERLLEAGFRPIAIPPYESALCFRREACVAALAPVAGAGLRLLAPPTYLVDGKFSVRIRRGEGEVFVWKGKEVAATPERLAELERFAGELKEILALPSVQ